MYQEIFRSHVPISLRGRRLIFLNTTFLTSARCIQTAPREWAYATHWPDSEQRNLALAPWTDYYNHLQPHGSLNYQPPISRSEPGTTS